MLLDSNKNIKIVDFGLSNTYIQTPSPKTDIIIQEPSSELTDREREEELREGSKCSEKEEPMVK